MTPRLLHRSHLGRSSPGAPPRASSIVPRVAARVLAAASLVPAIGACNDPVAPPPAPPPAIFVPPLHDAEVGEELRLRRGTEDWIWRVASVSPTEIEVDFRRMLDGAPYGEPASFRWSRNQFGVKDDYVVRELRRDRIEAAGRTWDCWLVRAGSTTEAIWYWVTDELPVQGEIGMAKDDQGKPVMGSAATVVPEGSTKR